MVLVLLPRTGIILSQGRQWIYGLYKNQQQINPVDMYVALITPNSLVLVVVEDISEWLLWIT